MGPLLSRKKLKKIERNTPRAQTTPDASFGPFFVFVGLRWPSLATQWLLWAFVGLRWPSTSPSRLGSLPVILHCDKALFVVCGGGEYIYELVKRINKRKKTYLRAQSFDMFESFGPTARHPSSFPPS